MRVGDVAFDPDIVVHAVCVLMYVHKSQSLI